ncbi:MAG TPA: phenylalanine--tRNA ligase subunit beta [Bacillales bacterium]|nr:phenylalanine--tRNA ligase subunit beta [Bacillales bacterium]
MLVSYNWLNEYVDTSGVSAEELADKITIAGIEVDAVHDMNRGANGVVVGYVKECGPHPNADKLNLCQVDVGEEEPLQIVCGAPNVAEGLKVPVAKPGAVLPGNVKIKRTKLRGEASNGMICSLQELGVEDKLVPREVSDGIFIFPEDAGVGEDALEYLNFSDRVLELDLTPNRADSLNMFGVAYEVGAILDRKAHFPEVQVPETREKTEDLISVQIENEEDNPYYGARIIKNVKIGPSPQWLQNRLIAAGIRPISNVVDITNFVLLEYGQPLHAFDYDRFGSKEVLTRRAKDGEKIVTLDGEERTLTNEHLVITNGREPVAVAGVMGGETSEVQDDTTTVLLEAAYFDRARVRKAASDLEIHSEASRRYERGVDPNRVIPAANRAAQLMVELAGGEVLAGISEAGQRTVEPKIASVTTDKVNRVLGTDLPGETMKDIFHRLGFEADLTDGKLIVTVPTRRMDISIEEDLIEEVGRLYGYDHLPTTLPFGNTTPGRLTERQAKRRKMRHYLEGAGLYEAITYSLTTSEKAALYSDNIEDAHPIQLPLPMSEEHTTLRLSLTPQLLDAVRYNLNRRVTDVALFEIGPVFMGKDENLESLPEEREKLAAVFTGLWYSHPWQKEKKPVDFYVAKGVLEGLFAELGLEGRVKFAQTKKDGLHPGRTATVLLDHRPVGFIGQIHPAKEKAFDLNETYVFEVDLETIMSVQATSLTYRTLPRYPSVSRDIALVVDEEVAAGNIRTVIRQAGGDLLKEVSLFDVYQGEHLEEGKKSLAFSLNYYDPERTLTDEEVVKAHDRVLEQVKEVFGAALRS